MSGMGQFYPAIPPPQAMKKPETTADIKRQLDALIADLQMQAGQGEETVDDEDYQRFLDDTYKRYKELVNLPAWKVGLQTMAGVPTKRKVSDQDHARFARAMFASVGTGEDDVLIRNHVRNIFGEKILPINIQAEKYPQENFNDAINLLTRAPHEKEGRVKQLMREAISGDYASDYYASEGGRKDEVIEKDINAIIEAWLKQAAIEKPAVARGLGETPAIGGRYDPKEKFGQRNLTQYTPEALSPTFLKDTNDFAEGKQMQMKYFRDNNAMYAALGSSAQGIFNKTEKRLSRQYDVEKALGGYKNSYIDYVGDYGEGKVRPWSNQQWQVAMQNVTSTPEFQNLMTLPKEELGPLIEEARNDPSKPLNDVLNLTTSLISRPEDVTEWIVSKERSKWTDPRDRQIKEQVLRKNISNFMMVNLGDDMVAGADLQPITAKKLFNEWQDRKFDWYGAPKSPAVQSEEQRLRQKGFNLQPTGGI